MNCECGLEHEEGRLYYVSVARDVGGGDTRCALGPYQTHSEALARVLDARQLVEMIDAKAPWYFFGTLSLPSDVDQPQPVFTTRDVDLIRFWFLAMYGAVGRSEDRVPAELLTALGIVPLGDSVVATVIDRRRQAAQTKGGSVKYAIMFRGSIRAETERPYEVWAMVKGLIVGGVAARARRDPAQAQRDRRG